MIRIVAVAALLVTPALASAQQAETGQPPQRVRSVTLQAGQKCPQSSSTEIVVCNTIADPYRIPKALRDSGPIPAQNQSWVNRAADIDQTSRVAGGLPDTCSPIGTGGQSGCALQQNRAYAAARRAQQVEASQIPGSGE
jgi:hypothetical protein